MDHGLYLLQQIEANLPAIAGGWHSTPMPDGTYPYGTFYVTSSTIERGQNYYGEVHRGIINVWSRSGDPAEAFTLIKTVQDTLEGGVFAAGTPVTINQFRPDELRRNLEADGTTWRGYFTFTAQTNEVT